MLLMNSNTFRCNLSNGRIRDYYLVCLSFLIIYSNDSTVVCIVIDFLEILHVVQKVN